MASQEPDALADQQRNTWTGNASAWTKAVRAGQIESRQVTDPAIVRAIKESGARRALDVGCGEGWLVRELTENECDAVGIDASASLIASAREGPGRFFQLSYEELVADPNRLDREFEATVCNFSLLDDQTAPLLSALRTRLKPEGYLLIQTVHPLTADMPYRDGWRAESFDSFGHEFSEPMPWYYRTFGSWIEVVQRSGFAVEQCIEPMPEEGEVPLSLLLVCSKVEAEPETRKSI